MQIKPIEAFTANQRLAYKVGRKQCEAEILELIEKLISTEDSKITNEPVANNSDLCAAYTIAAFKELKTQIQKPDDLDR